MQSIFLANSSKSASSSDWLIYLGVGQKDKPFDKSNISLSVRTLLLRLDHDLAPRCTILLPRCTIFNPKMHCLHLARLEYLEQYFRMQKTKTGVTRLYCHNIQVGKVERDEFILMAGTNIIEIKNENDLIIIEKMDSKDIVDNIFFFPS